MPITINSILCAAPRESVYRIIRETDHWPALFEPCLAVRALERTAAEELIEVTALVNGNRTSWRSRRAFVPDICGIDSEAVEPMPLVRTMRTRWRVNAADAGRCVLVLEHDFTVLDDVAGLVAGVETPAEAEAYISRAIETNSRTELANIRDAAEKEPLLHG